jgi:hypothetical protein
VVVMSHIHVDGHDYMEIRLIRLMSIRSEQNRFAVLPQSPRHGLGLGTARIGRWGFVPQRPNVFSAVMAAFEKKKSEEN